MEQLSAAQRPRLFVLTDIGGDPDDQQSLIRLMVHAAEFEIEGLVATASGTPGELKEKTTRPDLIREIVDAYGAVRANLARHDPRFPDARDLRARVHSGNPERGREAVGAHGDTEGSRALIAAADRTGGDPRPLNVCVWGGQTDLAQALWRVRKERGPAGLRAFAARLRVYDINDQDRIADWMLAEFWPLPFYLLAEADDGRDKREGAYRGVYLGGDESLTGREWIDAHVRVGHGPLGALYPTKTWTAPNPHGVMKEGDTPSWLYFLPNGLGDPAHPEWGGWGGRFARRRPPERSRQHLPPYRDAADAVDDGRAEARAGVWRWRPAFQSEFAARMDWCMLPPERANHPPVPVLNGDADPGLRPVELRCGMGATVRLSAAGSRDPDRGGDALSYRWFLYPEAGTYPAAAADAVRLDGATSEAAAVTVPRDAAPGATLHVVLAVTDGGDPPLTRYRRAVLTVG